MATSKDLERMITVMERAVNLLEESNKVNRMTIYLSNIQIVVEKKEKIRK